MTHYEFMMILNPTIGEEEINKNLETVRTALTGAGATISKEDVWGEKKLAYKVKNSDTGYYVLWNLEIEGRSLKALNTDLNLNPSIWRYMFVNLDA